MIFAAMFLLCLAVFPHKGNISGAGLTLQSVLHREHNSTCRSVGYLQEIFTLNSNNILICIYPSSVFTSVEFGRSQQNVLTCIPLWIYKVDFLVPCQILFSHALRKYIHQKYQNIGRDILKQTIWYLSFVPLLHGPTNGCIYHKIHCFSDS